MSGRQIGLAALIAASTSSAAPSTSRARSNWTVIWVMPSALDEVQLGDAGNLA